MYRLLTRQPRKPKPEPGPRTILPPETPPASLAGGRPVHGDAAANPPAPVAVPLNNLPYPSLGSLFKGRDVVLAELRSGFERSAVQAIVPWQAIHGLGGIGKTRAAVEYAWRHADHYAALLFVEATDDFTAPLAGLCPVLGLAAGVTDDRQRAGAALDWLARRRDWLLIVDNVDTETAAAAVAERLAHLASGHILVTGRIGDWPAGIAARPLDVLDPAAATAFLLERTAGKRLIRHDDGARALELAGELDGLALALEQAAAFIRKHRLSFADYLRRWREADRKVREWHDGRLMQYPRPLATTWQTSVAFLPTAARALLDLLAWLAPEPLPRFLFDYSAVPEGLPSPFPDADLPRAVLRELSGDADADPETAFAELRAVSLLRPPDESDFASEGRLHRLVGLLARERQTEEERKRALGSALEVVDAATIGDPDDVRTWPVWNPLRFHVRVVADFAAARGVAEPTGWLLNQLAILLYTKALHAEAEPLYRRSLALFEQIHGPDDSTVATCLNNLAQLLGATNRLDEAEPLMHRALAIDERRFGPGHPKVARDLNNLAQLLKDPNRLDQAEPLMRRALVIDECSFGPDHPNVATDLNNLAQLLKATDRLDEAEPLLRRALGIDEISFGPDHPNIARDLNNFARLLQDTDRLDEAEPLILRALAIDERSFGLDHPEVATDLNNLALLLKVTNRPAEAEAPMRRALAILLKSTRVNGHEHPHLRTAFGNYRGLLKALSLDEDAIREHLLSLGPEAGFEAAEYAELLERVGSRP